MENVYQLIEVAQKTGQIKKGINEVTKAIERGKAKIVAVASDITPPEVVMHLPMLCKEKDIPYFEVGSREELGAAAGLGRPTAAVAVISEGDAKDVMKELKRGSAKGDSAGKSAEEKQEVKPVEEKVEAKPGEVLPQKPADAKKKAPAKKE
ncbi:50S ribosomal protein L7ae [Candidatus Woesearchaeota archaeon]|nr:50S ribosomal protein L7ae [Candidatus Woesearchaeota archaeon]